MFSGLYRNRFCLIIDLPIRFNRMVTMQNKFHSKQSLLETKMFFSIVVYASDTASGFY